MYVRYGVVLGTVCTVHYNRGLSSESGAGVYSWSGVGRYVRYMDEKDRPLNEERGTDAHLFLGPDDQIIINK